LALSLVALSQLACAACSGRMETAPRAPAVQRPRVEVAPPQIEPSPPPLDPESPCGRAERCCRVWATDMPSVDADAACGGPAEDASAPDGDARCERMRTGWREALILLHPDAEPPEVCAELAYAP
jgi:hypothetical protein